MDFHVCCEEERILSPVLNTHNTILNINFKLFLTLIEFLMQIFGFSISFYKPLNVLLTLMGCPSSLRHFTVGIGDPRALHAIVTLLPSTRRTSRLVISSLM